MPTNYKRLGLVPRFADIVYYNANAGVINLLLFSKVRETPNSDQYNYDRMVKNYVEEPQTGIPAIKLTSAISAMGRANNRRYLDLERGGVINILQLRDAANAFPNGFDNPEFSIDPAFQ